MCLVKGMSAVPKKLLAIVFSIMLLVLPNNVRAQDPLTQSFTNRRGTLTVDYPAEWQAGNFLEMVILTNQAGSVSPMQPPIPAGVIIVTIGAWPLEDETSFEDLQAEFLEIQTSEIEETEQAIVYETSESIEIGDKPAYSLVGANGETASYVLLIDLGNQTFLTVLAATPIGEMDAFLPTIDAIAEATQYNPPPESVVTGSVIWQQMDSIDYDGEQFAEPGKVAIGPDDTVYIADKRRGNIVIMDDAGSLLGFIDPFSDRREIKDLTVAPDGTLFIVRGDQKVYHVDQSGNILAEWGEGGQESGQFGSYSPIAIEITPNGNLAVFDRNSEPDGTTYERVQIWDTSGNLLNEFRPVHEDGTGFFTSNLAVGPDGSIYLESFGGTVSRFSQDGTLIMRDIGVRKLPSTSFGAIAVGPDGFLVVATAYEGIIYQFDAEGNYLREFGQRWVAPENDDTTPTPFAEGEFYLLEGVGVLSNGDIIVVDNNFSYWQIVRFTFEE